MAARNVLPKDLKQSQTQTLWSVRRGESERRALNIWGETQMKNRTVKKRRDWNRPLSLTQTLITVHHFDSCHCINSYTVLNVLLITMEILITIIILCILYFFSFYKGFLFYFIYNQNLSIFAKILLHRPDSHLTQRLYNSLPFIYYWASLRCLVEVTLLTPHYPEEGEGFGWLPGQR